MQRAIERRLARLEGDAAEDVMDRLSDDELNVLVWEVLRALAAHAETAEHERSAYRRRADAIEADIGARLDLAQQSEALLARPDIQRLIEAGQRGTGT
jgi:hypothetical protein